MTRSPAWARAWSLVRLALALVIAAAVAAQLVATVRSAAERGHDVGTTIANFFSFFTILSNLGACAVLTWAALWMLTRRTDLDAAAPASRSIAVVEPRGLAVALASVTTYLVITGAVYNTLLRFVPLPIGGEPIPWSNEVMHTIAPLLLLVDVFVGPARRALAWRTVWAVAAFPVVWVVYTLVRGPLVTDPGGAPPYWYPYPFLNPHGFDDGYVTVSLYIAGIAAAIVAVAFVVVGIGRRRSPTLTPRA